MLPSLWHSITWPLVGAIFWWIVGRGIDALLATRRKDLAPSIAWPETTIASLLLILSTILCTGLLFGEEAIRSEFIYPWRWALGASVLWLALSATVIAARIVQRRLRRNQNAAA